MKRVLLACVLSVTLFAIYRMVGVWLGDTLERLGSGARFEDLTLLHAIMPGYWLAVSTVSQARTELAYQRLQPLLEGREMLPVNSAVLAAGAVLGFVYGAWDMALGGEPSPEHTVLEWWLRIGNGGVWLCSGMVFTWRLANAIRFYRLGQQIDVDPFNLDRVRPVGRMATTDVLIIMGAMALTPLQSLSSDFDIEFYRVAFLVGIVSSLIFLILPQLGVHQQVRRAKRARLQRLQEEIEASDPNQYSIMESLLAHRDRLQKAPTWPTDTRGFSRAIFYLVVPPLAWVGAAIVEKGVDQFF